MNEQQKYSLTIVTVCFNAREGLLRTLESVLSHKKRYPLDIEHLIVDGASTDGTPQLLQQWLEEGKIEAYVSEPDTGIYDAMNKGIRLARGKVLYFLNADDTLTGESLIGCVEPIVRGETQQCAASVQIVGGIRERVDPPRYQYLYMSSPCCHPGYFASAELYRKLEGYDEARYRCLADIDIMHRAYAYAGLPLVVDSTVSVFVEGGFSANGGFDYLPEYVDLAERNWPQVLKRCQEDVEYRELVAGELTNRCMELAKWRIVKKQDASPCASMLQRQLVSLSGIGWNIMVKLGLRWAAEHYLPYVKSGQLISNRREKFMYWVRLCCSMQPGNRYETANGFPVRSIKAALWAKWKAVVRKICK